MRSAKWLTPFDALFGGTFSLERLNDATLFISTCLKALECGDLPLQHSSRRYIAQYLVDFVVGRGLQDEDQSTVCDRKSSSEDFLVSFKFQERIKGGKDSLFQNLYGFLRRSEARSLGSNY
jgi:hypothetical protein